MAALGTASLFLVEWSGVERTATAPRLRRAKENVYASAWNPIVVPAKKGLVKPNP